MRWGGVSNLNWNILSASEISHSLAVLDSGLVAVFSCTTDIQDKQATVTGVRGNDASVEYVALIALKNDTVEEIRSPGEDEGYASTRINFALVLKMPQDR